MEEKILLPEGESTTDVYKHHINTDKVDVSPHGTEVLIYFINGVFSNCIFHFSNVYIRDEWKVLAAINARIAELERFYEKRGEHYYAESP